MTRRNMEMRIMTHSSVLIALALGAAVLVPSAAAARDIVVQMKDNGADGMNVFEPAFVKAAPGDRIRFMATSPVHNAETIPTMLPDGVAPSKGLMGKEFDLIVAKPGLYGIKCLPHYSMGMVALIQVGAAPANLARVQAASLPPFAKKRMAPLLARVK